MSNLTKRLAVILLAGLIVFAFVACKKKNKDTIESQSSLPSSSQTPTIDSNRDDADDMTSSELAELEEEIFGNGNNGPTLETPSNSGTGSSGGNSNGSSTPSGNGTSSSTNGQTDSSVSGGTISGNSSVAESSVSGSSETQTSSTSGSEPTYDNDEPEVSMPSSNTPGITFPSSSKNSSTTQSSGSSSDSNGDTDTTVSSDTSSTSDNTTNDDWPDPSGPWF